MENSYSIIVFLAVVIVSLAGCREHPKGGENYYKMVICYQSLGRSAEEVETDVVEPAEKIVNSLQSILSINSASTRNRGIITLEISQTYTMEETRSLIKDRLTLKRALLPLDIPDPVITPVTESVKACE